jgi:hypothetical protein
VCVAASVDQFIGLACGETPSPFPLPRWGRGIRFGGGMGVVFAWFLFPLKERKKMSKRARFHFLKR